MGSVPVHPVGRFAVSGLWAHTHTMRRRWIVSALALIAASCGDSFATVPARIGDGEAVAAGGVCGEFVSRTEPIARTRVDRATYQSILSEAIFPVVDTAYRRGLPIDENQDLALALERIYAGDARSDDLWAIEAVGRMLAEDGLPECNELWHNLGPMAPTPSPEREEAPAIEIESDYEVGTADRACDVFIRTVNGWEEAASTGTEYGPAMAGAVDALIGGLETLGITEATANLTEVALLWRTKPWVQANEEGGVPLIAAGELLTDVESGRCGELFDAVNPPSRDVPYEPPEPITIDLVSVSDFDPGMACGRARVASLSAIPSTEPLDADARGAVEALRSVEEEGNWFTSTFRYEIFSRTDDELVLLGASLDGTMLSDAYFDRVGDEWRPSGWGTCEWRSDDYEQIAWQIRPGFTVDPSSRTIELLAEDWCGSVTNSGHEVLVVSYYDDDSVDIAVWQSLSPRASGDGTGFGDLSCSIGTQILLKVELPEPIGSRAISKATVVSPGTAP